jgi:hypothetical protein
MKNIVQRVASRYMKEARADFPTALINKALATWASKWGGTHTPGSNSLTIPCKFRPNSPFKITFNMSSYDDGETQTWSMKIWGGMLGGSIKTPAVFTMADADAWDTSVAASQNFRRSMDVAEKYMNQMGQWFGEQDTRDFFDQDTGYRPTKERRPSKYRGPPREID